MKTKILFLLLVFTLLLSACGPVTPIPAPTATSSPEPTKVPVTSWPGMKPGWTTYRASPKLFNPIYDPNGYVWARNPLSAYRWEIASGKMDSFTVKDGFPAGVNDWINHNGKLWLALNDGSIGLFDGKHWTAKKLSEKPLTEFSKTPGRLWVYSQEEKRVFFHENEAWTEFKDMPKDVFLQAEAQSSDGRLWFKNWGEVRSFDGENWVKHPNLEYVNYIFTANNGTLYFCFENIILLYAEEKFQPVGFPGNDYSYYPVSPQQREDALEGELLVGLYKDENVQPFIVHTNGIVDEFSGPFWDRDNSSPELSGFYTIKETRDGLLLFAENKSTIALYKDGKLKKFTVPVENAPWDNIIGNHRVIGFAPDGKLWLDSHQADTNLPVYFDGTSLQTPFSEEETGGVELGYITKINAQGELWSWEWDEYLNYFKIGEKPVRYPLRFNTSDFDFAPDGSIWFLGNDGYIAHIHPQDLSENRINAPEYFRIGDGIVDNRLSANRILVAPNGNIWVFVPDTGLYRFDGKNWKYMGMYAMKSDSSRFAIGSNGDVWAGYDYHLARYDGQRWTEYQRNCIYPNNLMVTPDQAVWYINGCDGVMRFDGTDWAHYTRAKELSDIVPKEILLAPDGALWFIAPDAWVRYQPSTK